MRSEIESRTTVFENTDTIIGFKIGSSFSLPVMSTDHMEF